MVNIARSVVNITRLRNKRPSLQKLIKSLKKEGIHTVTRRNKEGFIYGITYVDHQTKCVFNGSALGKSYSAKFIQERCTKKEAFEPKLLPHSAQKPIIGLQPQAIAVTAETKDFHHYPEDYFNSKEAEKILEVLIESEYCSDYLPYQLKKKRKKKKKKSCQILIKDHRIIKNVSLLSEKIPSEGRG